MFCKLQGKTVPTEKVTSRRCHAHRDLVVIATWIAPLGYPGYCCQPVEFCSCRVADCAVVTCCGLWGIKRIAGVATSDNWLPSVTAPTRTSLHFGVPGWALSCGDTLRRTEASTGEKAHLSELRQVADLRRPAAVGLETSTEEAALLFLLESSSPAFKKDRLGSCRVGGGAALNLELAPVDARVTGEFRWTHPWSGWNWDSG